MSKSPHPDLMILSPQNNSLWHDITFSPVGPAGPGGPKGPGRPCQLKEHKHIEGNDAQRSPCLSKQTNKQETILL